MTSIDQLAFPVLCLARDASIVVAGDPDRLQRCHALAFFKNRYFDDLVIFDSNGERYRVVAASVVSPPAGVARWAARVLNRPLRVRLELRRETPASVATAKAEVLGWLRKAPDLWEASRDLTEWERLVTNAPNMRRLIGLFA